MTNIGNTGLGSEHPSWLKIDFDEIVSVLTNEDELGCVIRAHIRIEQLLRKALNKWIPHPEYLNKLNADYDGLVTIALMHGMDESYGPPFRAIGKLRNDFAHKPDARLTKQSVGNLYDCLSSEEKQAVQGIYESMKRKFDFDGAAGRLADLNPFKQFQIIAITLWTIAQAMAMTGPADAEQGGTET